MNSKPRLSYPEYFGRPRRTELTAAEKRAPVTGEVLALTLHGVGQTVGRVRSALTHRADLHLRWLNILRRRLQAVEAALDIAPTED